MHKQQGKNTLRWNNFKHMWKSIINQINIIYRGNIIWIIRAMSRCLLTSIMLGIWLLCFNYENFIFERWTSKLLNSMNNVGKNVHLNLWSSRSFQIVFLNINVITPYCKNHLFINGHSMKVHWVCIHLLWNITSCLVML